MYALSDGRHRSTGFDPCSISAPGRPPLGTMARAPRRGTEGLKALTQPALDFIRTDSIRRLRGHALRRLLGDGASLIQGLVAVLAMGWRGEGNARSLKLATNGFGIWVGIGFDQPGCAPRRDYWSAKRPARKRRRPNPVSARLRRRQARRGSPGAWCTPPTRRPSRRPQRSRWSIRSLHRSTDPSQSRARDLPRRRSVGWGLDRPWPDRRR
jgi:hypothetical protein